MRGTGPAHRLVGGSGLSSPPDAPVDWGGSATPVRNGYPAQSQPCAERGMDVRVPVGGGDPGECALENPPPQRAIRGDRVRDAPTRSSSRGRCAGPPTGTAAQRPDLLVAVHPGGFRPSRPGLRCAARRRPDLQRGVDRSERRVLSALRQWCHRGLRPFCQPPARGGRYGDARDPGARVRRAGGSAGEPCPRWNGDPLSSRRLFDQLRGERRLRGCGASRLAPDGGGCDRLAALVRSGDLRRTAGRGGGDPGTSYHPGRRRGAEPDERPEGRGGPVLGGRTRRSLDPPWGGAQRAVHPEFWGRAPGGRALSGARVVACVVRIVPHLRQAPRGVVDRAPRLRSRRAVLPSSSSWGSLRVRTKRQRQRRNAGRGDAASGLCDGAYGLL